MLEDDKIENFITKELEDCLSKWSKQHISEHIIMELSDAFWLAQCILKVSCRHGNIFQTKKEDTASELADCHYIISEAPKMFATIQQEVSVNPQVLEAINDLKKRIRIRDSERVHTILQL
jgi:hypothetical protein